MHIYFSGIGGTGIGPLALIAAKAGYKVTGSDKQSSDYIEYLIKNGVTDVHIGQTYEAISAVHDHDPIDWIVYSSAIVKENPNHPELKFAEATGIKATKRGEFLFELLGEANQKMIAIAGTHGKTTATAMMIWLFKELGLPVSHSVGAKLSFATMGNFDNNAQHFVYEADEYDRNFLNFYPLISIIPGIAYDHPDIYPTLITYLDAYREFLGQSEKAVLWREDATRVGITETDKVTILDDNTDLHELKLLGEVNRKNAHAVIVAAEKLGLCDYHHGVKIMNKFPGVSRRFEMISHNIYSDYAHTPEKILGALQLAKEVAGDNVVVVYEGLHNTRQHFIAEQLQNLFNGIKKLYVVPSYLAREDESLEMLTPEKLCVIIQQPEFREPSLLDNSLKNAIKTHVHDGDLVLCFSAGGGGSLDQWLRREF